LSQVHRANVSTFALKSSLLVKLTSSSFSGIKTAKMYAESSLATATLTVLPKPRSKPKAGLRLWMQRVLEECDSAAVDFSADPVHDLRVAIRRCRSLADGLIPIDPNPDWKKMKRAARSLFSALGELRDKQVLAEWVEKLFPAEDPPARKLLAFTESEQVRLKVTAHQELERFDRKAWQRWSVELPRRLNFLRPGHIVFRHLALERWTQALAAHRHAMRSRSATSLHQARIAIKRFRYTVENFLPEQHRLWSDDLKELQDLLGEIHDLDVLWHVALQIHAFANAEERTRWHRRILEERSNRLARYREKLNGKDGLWRAWRSQLPPENQVRAAALERLKVWAAFLDPNVAQSRRVSALASELFHGLVAHRLIPAVHEKELHSILELAALAHQVKPVRDAESRPKVSARLLRILPPPLGYSAHELKLAAAVVRFHRGDLPSASKKTMQQLERADRRQVALLAGILRLANVFASASSAAVTRLITEERNRQLRIYAEGYRPSAAFAQQLATERYLLESVLRRAILVRPFRKPAPKRPTLVRPR
jgi:CHAD domain-containing protein